MGHSKELVKAFKFLSDISKMSKKSDINLSSTKLSFDFEDLDYDNEYIEVNLDSESIVNNSPIIRISRPSITENAPKISDALKFWLESDWNDPLIEDVKVKNFYENQDGMHHFWDTKEALEFNEVIVKRQSWQKTASKKRRAMDLFDKFYQFRQEFKALEDTHDLFLGSYLFVAPETKVSYPFVMRPATIEYDIKTKYIEIIPKEEGTIFSNHLLDELRGVDVSKFKEINDEFKSLDIHPFDNEMVDDYVVKLINSLTPLNSYVKKEERNKFKRTDEKIIIYENNYMLLSRRPDSMVEFLEKVSEEAERDNLPQHLHSFIDPNANQIVYDYEEPSFEERLANIGGESSEVLLAKEANEEQLNIIKRLNSGHSGVLVQGPPGTGKTHTIANITGHFLSEGKTVLITSHTKKALNVLKDKLPEGLNDLAVSLVDDNKKDLEKSVNKISEIIGSSDLRKLHKNIESYELERNKLILDLADSRRKIIDIKIEETKPVTYKGKSYSYSQLANYIRENEEQLNLIPGKVKADEFLPLSLEELELLYKTNIIVSKDEEDQFTLGLLNPEILIKPNNFEEYIMASSNIKSALSKLSEYTGSKFNYSEENNNIRYKRPGVPFFINDVDDALIQSLSSFYEKNSNVEDWVFNAVEAGKRGGNYKKIWEVLINALKTAKAAEDEYVQLLFLKNIKYTGTLNDLELLRNLETLKNKESGFNVSLLKLFNKQNRDIFNNFYINDQTISTKEDALVAYSYVDKKIKEDEAIRVWNELIGNFESIEKSYNTIDDLNYYLDWYDDTISFFKTLKEKSFNISYLFNYNSIKTLKERIIKMFEDITFYREPVIQIARSIFAIDDFSDVYKSSIESLKENGGAELNIALLKSLEQKDFASYAMVYDEVKDLYLKESNIKLRNELIGKLHKSAPIWALSIKNREDIHGEEFYPKDIEAAWDFKQYSRIIDDVLSINYNALLEQSYLKGKKLRALTAKLASEKAWEQLVIKTRENRELQSALQRWKLNMDKIGKGTGKTAHRYRKQAREEMRKAQEAIPVWIMPINEVVNNMTPGENKFDVIIIDEASQSNITSLGVLALAEKVIVVGDDKQVSPISFASEEQILNVRSTHFTDIEAQNYNLWEPETSLYDLAKMVYEPLMLKEHFRCVPEIIDFSSYDSYDGNIKALRGSNTAQVYPALVEFRVAGGTRENNVNRLEAKNIASLIYGMTKTKKYDGLSIGVITMLSSNQQAELINREIRAIISPEEFETRNIIVGHSSFFQGDERDVILLSLIDSNEKDTPLSLASSGRNDTRKKRYNVAASRARDQLWVVHSLDVNKDLKSDDYRRKIIEHARYPYKNEAKLDKLSDSSFEKEVAKALIGRGYTIEQQKAVGPYRIDIVVSNKEKEIALELDGETFHGPDKFEADLERQTVLERVGWKFIRLRGSEYFRNKEQAIDRICADLKTEGIVPTFETTDYELQSNAEFTDELDSVLRMSAKMMEIDPIDYINKSLPSIDTSKLGSPIDTEDTKVQKNIKEILSTDKEAVNFNHSMNRFSSQEINHEEKSSKSDVIDNLITDENKSTLKSSKKVNGLELEKIVEEKKETKSALKVNTKVTKLSQQDEELLKRTDALISKSNGTVSQLDEIEKTEDLISRTDSLISKSSKAKPIQSKTKKNDVNNNVIEDSKPKTKQTKLNSIDRFKLRENRKREFAQQERQRIIQESKVKQSVKTNSNDTKTTSSTRKEKQIVKKNLNQQRYNNVKVNKYSPQELKILDRNLQSTNFSIKIHNNYAILSKKGKWTKELNSVSWNNGRINYDIRSWGDDHKKLGKGVTLNNSELRRLKELLEDI